MKKLIFGVLTLVSILSYADERHYWFEHCDAATDAYRFMRNMHPEVDIAPEKKCNMYSHVRPATSACKQELLRIGLFAKKAKFKVDIDTENSGVKSFVLKYSKDGFGCNLKKIKSL